MEHVNPSTHIACCNIHRTPLYAAEAGFGFCPTRCYRKSGRETYPFTCGGRELTSAVWLPRDLFNHSDLPRAADEPTPIGEDMPDPEWSHLLDAYTEAQTAAAGANAHAFASRFIGAMTRVAKLPGGPELWLDSLVWAGRGHDVVDGATDDGPLPPAGDPGNDTEATPSTMPDVLNYSDEGES
jgi:hypothetical protein